jgi:trimethylamine:corrinoid methyltransferase-like protein
MLRKMTKGISVDDPNSILDLIDDVRPSGHYLETKNTYDNFKSIWNSRYMDHDSYPLWEANGSLSMEDRLHIAADEMIKKPNKNPLDKNKLAEIQNIISVAKKNM